MNKYKAILAFDGVCNLCNSFVRILIAIDRKAKIGLVQLQADKAKKFFDAEILESNDSVLLKVQNKIFTESDAILKVFDILGGGWKIMRIFKILPGSLRDILYRYIAKNRYKWFGRKDQCPVPDENDMRHFI